MPDYLKLAREARAYAAGVVFKRRVPVASATMFNLCDAIEAQAAEIERLRAGVLTADRLKYEVEKLRAERAEAELVRLGHAIPPGPIGRGRQ